MATSLPYGNIVATTSPFLSLSSSGFTHRVAFWRDFWYSEGRFEAGEE
ncbi:MAG: hypothetical protein LBG27_11550 [Spirochaetaceae bacterium]|jgi:hypothetical protein|nr:hypothetical protein [Spirochaetaceae bacterium]